jgi:hypothetical protein
MSLTLWRIRGEKNHVDEVMCCVQGASKKADCGIRSVANADGSGRVTQSIAGNLSSFEPQLAVVSVITVTDESPPVEHNPAVLGPLGPSCQRGIKALLQLDKLSPPE